MPRGKSIITDEALDPNKYPQWFADYADSQEKQRGALQWLEDYEPDDVKQLVISVLKDGGAMFLALTRDGGALSITVMFGDAKKRMYAASGEELDIILARMR
jgi:hypothetical protein